MRISHRICNEDRAFGSTLSNAISLRFGDAGLPPDRKIQVELRGSGGQSFCAFLTKGVRVTLEGDCNDYVAKGLCGAEVRFKLSNFFVSDQRNCKEESILLQCLNKL